MRTKDIQPREVKFEEGGREREKQREEGEFPTCHSKTRSYLPFKQRFQPGVLLVLVAIEIEHFHVTCVRSGTVEHLRREGGREGGRDSNKCTANS